MLTNGCVDCCADHNAALQANVEQMQELASSLQIKSMPWFIFYKGAGEPVAKFTASLQPNRLAKLRAEIALHKS